MSASPCTDERSGLILTLNAGSSSIKFAVYSAGAGAGAGAGASDPVLLAKGQVEGIGTRPHFLAQRPSGEVVSESWWEPAADGCGSDGGHARAFQQIWSWLADFSEGGEIMAVGHRVAHGGEACSQPVRIRGTPTCSTTASTCQNHWQRSPRVRP